MSSSALLSSSARHGGAIGSTRASSGAACSTSGRPAALFAHAADRRRAPPVVAPTPTTRSAHRQRLRMLSPPPAATFFDQAWGTQIDGQSLASQLFSLSLLPYLGFLYHLRKPEAKTPPLVFGGFCFLLVFVFATIPAGIYGEPTGPNDLLCLPERENTTQQPQKGKRRRSRPPSDQKP
jgi:hypothetical protein